MAPKKGKKTKEKKAAKTGSAEPGQLVEKLLSMYEKRCAAMPGLLCTDLCQAMRKCIEGNTLLVRFIMQGDRAVVGTRPLMNVEPLLQALRDARYVFIQELRVWNVIMPYEMVASVSLLLEKRIFELRFLELVDCLVEADSLRRLAPSLTTCSTLKNLTLDHNEFGDEGCQKLCNGLHGNRTLLSLSMTFCDLGVDSGAILGKLIVNTAIRDVYLDGNSLESEGAMDLVQALAERAELEHFEKEELTKRSQDDDAVTAVSSLKAKEGGYSTSRTESPGAVDSDAGSKKSSLKKKKGKKKKKKSKEPPGPPVVGPWIRRLHLADNGIDAMGPTGLIGPITCTQLLGTLLQHSTCLEELDLDDNLIGDLAGRQILAALQARAAGGLPSVKMRTTHRMKSDTFNEIFKLGAGLKKKKKKGKKKKKK